MTEKKRGRPVGSKNRPKVSPLVEEKVKRPEDYLNFTKVGVLHPDGTISTIDDSVKAEEHKQAVTEGAKRALKELKEDSETFFPEGWEKMSKTEKLKFFTASRR